MNELIQDHGLKNWIKACIGLRCVRDGMLPFIEEKCGDLYSGNKTYTTQFCQLTNYSCTSCSLKELRPNHSEDDCPIKSHKINCGCKSSANKKICQNLGSCGVLFDLILNKHVNKAPRWNNSDCSKWYKNGWEQMKCFIDIPGYNDKEHLSQADITAFVHICQNNIALKDLFRTDIDKLIQVRADRNEIYHSGKMDISDDELKEYIAHMRDALRLSVFTKTDTQKFLDTLTKLETDNNFEIDATQEMIARKDALNALIEESKTLHEENTNIAENTTAIKHRIAAFAVVQDKHMKCITDHLTKIKCHMKSVKEEHNKTAEVLLQHSNDLKTITSAIDQHTTCFKNLQRELVTQTEIILGIETISMGIERIVIKNYRMISEIQPEINTILLTVEKMYQLIQDTANIQGKIVLDINGIPNKAELLHEIVQLWKSFKTNPGLNASDEIGHCLSVTEGELEKEGIKVDSVQDGSVEICFRCTSIPNWIKLCEKCIDGRMAKFFWPLQNHLKSKDGFENLKIAVNMYETDFVESVEAIVKQLYPKLISKFPNFVKSESDSDPTQIKWNDVLGLVLEHEKSRAPASQIPGTICIKKTCIP
ncbi:hypothetical protein DPMN_190529 [Dreissena polymorpha]|uniref:DZIP3-like HEPN domain-containing protein n=1 Tax=Dreissena polymorpha TaxID=45954 RepID=A0A9D4IBU2_DREPO|nr:hypothetical protein DPMN_190529 [Dreissena polymorpha]